MCSIPRCFSFPQPAREAVAQIQAESSCAPSRRLQAVHRRSSRSMSSLPPCCPSQIASQSPASSDAALLRVLGPPSISDIPDQIIDEDSATGLILFMVDDAESPPASINVTAQSSNTNLVSAPGIDLGGTGSNRTLRITPLPNA